MSLYSDEEHDGVDGLVSIVHNMWSANNNHDDDDDHDVDEDDDE
jgi:hypothetical protein